ncbi:MAG: hypothetical protein DHS20C15_22680 [Planctomycetota bacterium]|nr:MAG: hypothetical protein DHS20C15_22680 [Planctomycetota bacterium]
MQALRTLAMFFGTALSALAADAFEVTTPGKAGTGGAVPTLGGTGPLTPGSMPNALHVAEALPGAPVVFVLGLSELAVPFQGGVLGPAPDTLLFGFSVDASGALALPFTVPPSLPAGFRLWVQAFVSDPAGLAGRSATNTLALELQAPRPLFPGKRFEVGAEAQDLEFADLDSDGFLDAVTVLPHDDALSVARGREDADFESHTESATGEEPISVAVGDLDGDGNLDAVTGNHASHDVSLLFGDGHADFAPAVSLPIVLDTQQVELADVNADGVLDLITSRRRESSFAPPSEIAVSLGKGDGTFRAHRLVDLAPGEHVEWFAIQDLDQDGLVDVAVSASQGSSETLWSHAGLGNGQFAPAVQVGTLPMLGPSLPPHVRDLVATDLDADGFVDLVLPVDATGGGVVAAFGLGAGAFDAADVIPATVGRANGLDIADFNADGLLDLAVARASSSAALFIATGSGSFESPIELQVGDWQQGVRILEASGEAVARVIVLGSGAPRLAVFRSAPDGLPEASTLIPSGGVASAVGVADFNLDELLDVVKVGSDAKLELLLGDGEGGLGAPLAFDTGVLPKDLIIDDLNLDGRPDVVVAHDAGLSIHLGAAAGGFAPEQTLATPEGSWQVRSGDLNGDDIPDLAATTKFSDSVLIYHGEGDGSFTLAQDLSAGSEPAGLALEDVNLDGSLDLVVGLEGEFSAGIRIYPGAPGADFEIFSSFYGGGDVVEIAFADLDHDGFRDLLSVTSTPSGVARFRGHGDGTFTDIFFTPDGGSSVVVADFNSDGIDDAAFPVLGSDLVSVMLGVSGAFGPRSSYSGLRSNSSLAHGDFDGDGDADLISASTHGPELLLLPNLLLDE